jgi:hypothetical protein
MTVGSNPEQSKREFTLLGQQVPFDFVDGTLRDKGTLIRKASGVFRTRKAYIALIYTVPAAEYDEAAFSKMLDSIQPAADDSLPDADSSADPEDAAPQDAGAQSPAGEPGEATKPETSAEPDRE